MIFPNCASHFFVKAFNEAGITFPTTKTEMVEKAADIQVRTGDNDYTPLRDIIASFGPEAYSSGTAMMCAYSSAALQPVLRMFTGN